MTCPPTLTSAKEFCPAFPAGRRIIFPLIISLHCTKLYPFCISSHMESSGWFILSLKRAGIPANVTGSCFSASHGCFQPRFSVQLHGNAMLPWGKSDAAMGKERCCHGEGASQQQRGGGCVPAEAEGFFESISHPL